MLYVANFSRSLIRDKNLLLIDSSWIKVDSFGNYQIGFELFQKWFPYL